MRNNKRVGIGLKNKLWVLAVLLVLSGCANAASAQMQAVESEAERVVLLGEISQIIGNMIHIDIVERSEEWAPMTEEELEALRERMAERFGGEMPEAILGEGFEMPEGFMERFGGGFEIPEGFMERFSDGTSGRILERFDGELPEGLMERFGIGEGGFNRGGMARGYIPTGDKKDIIIPTGAPILERGADETESEINLGSLSTGDVIEVTYASDGETVAKVVKQPSARRTGRMFSADGGEGFRMFGSGDLVEIFSFEVNP
jgi:hypothetical protein